MQRAIDASVRRIASTARLIDASERFTASRPLHASDGLVRASEWLSHAAAHLDRATRGLHDRTIYAAPAQLLEILARWIDAAGCLNSLSDQLDAATTRLIDAVERGAVRFRSRQAARRSDRGASAPCPFIDARSSPASADRDPPPPRSSDRSSALSIHRSRTITIRRREEIRAMRQHIPNFVSPTSRGESRRLVKAASVPQPFVELMAVLVKNNPALVRGGGPDPEQSRDLMSYAEAYAPVADELEALAQFVRHSVTAAKDRAGSDALTTYALARRLAKHPQNADLAPHVDDMRRVLGVRGRKAKTQPAPETEPPAPEIPAPAPVTPVKLKSA